MYVRMYLRTVHINISCTVRTVHTYVVSAGDLRYTRVETEISERTFVILATMAKDEDVHARDFARILHTISFFRSRDYCVIVRETVSFL